MEPSPDAPIALDELVWLLLDVDLELELVFREVDVGVLKRDVAARKAAELEGGAPKALLPSELEDKLDSAPAEEVVLPPDVREPLDAEEPPELRVAAVLTELMRTSVRPRRPPRTRGALSPA